MSPSHKLPNQLLVETRDLEPEQLLDLAIDSGIQHICQRNGHCFKQEMISSQCILESPDSYLEFPIAAILAPSLLNDASERALLATETMFNCSNQKLDVLKEIADTLQFKCLAQTIVDDALAVTDEFFTNAIFNAPFVDLSTHLNPGISRQNLEIKLADGKFARIFLAHDEARLLIGCEDPYGSLNLQEYMTKIRSTYKRGPAATMNFGPGGAGIGSFIIFNAGCSLYFGVWPGRSTILCCVIPLGLKSRQRQDLGKHVHWVTG